MKNITLISNFFLYVSGEILGKIDLKAKNPFGKDLDMGKLKTYWGLGLMATVVVIFGGMVVLIKSQAKTVTKGIDGLHEKLRGR